MLASGIDFFYGAFAVLVLACPAFALYNLSRRGGHTHLIQSMFVDEQRWQDVVQNRLCLALIISTFLLLPVIILDRLVRG